MISRLFPVMVFALLPFISSHGWCQEPAPSEGASAFLKDLSEGIDERILGAEEMIVLMEGRRTGKASHSIQKGGFRGRVCYLSRFTVTMDFGGGATHEMKAEAHIAPDLTTLSCVMTTVDQEGTSTEVIEVDGAGKTLTETKSGPGGKKTWSAPVKAGLVSNMAEAVLMKLLAVRGVDRGTKTFLERHQSKIFLLPVKALGKEKIRVEAGQFLTMGYEMKGIVFDEDEGKPLTDEAGGPVHFVRRYRMDPSGKTIAIEFEGSPVRFEKNPEE